MKEKKSFRHKRLSTYTIGFFLLVVSFSIWRAYEKKPMIYLLNTGEHENLGDHLLQFSTHRFLKHFFPTYPITEVTHMTWWKEKLSLIKRITKHDWLLISAGGFMGTLWPGEDVTVRDIIESFPHNRIIILPQSFFYHTDQAERKIKEHRNLFTKYKNVVIFHREYRSYARFFPSIVSDPKRVFLYPDMALFLPVTKYPQEGRERVIIAFRKDKEKTRSPLLMQKIQQFCNKSNIPYLITDTCTNYLISTRKREDELEKFFDLIGRGRLLITDRIHGMLFAEITGTPCIAVDNISKKVSGVFEWMKNCSYITCVEEENITEELFTNYYQMKSNPGWDRREIDLQFIRMARHIKTYMQAGQSL